MYKNKTETLKIFDRFITSVIIISALILISSGISISKINTEFMETGIKSAKIVAERESQQISITTDDSILLTPKKDYPDIDGIIAFLPPPVNTAYFTIKNFNFKNIP